MTHEDRLKVEVKFSGHSEHHISEKRQICSCKSERKNEKDFEIQKATKEIFRQGTGSILRSSSWLGSSKKFLLNDLVIV